MLQVPTAAKFHKPAELVEEVHARLQIGVLQIGVFSAHVEHPRPPLLREPHVELLLSREATLTRLLEVPDDALGFAGEGESQCMGAVLEDYGGDGASYLVCMSSAYSDGAQYLTANVNCAEGQLDACEQTRETTTSGCTQIPESGQQAFLACVAGT